MELKHYTINEVRDFVSQNPKDLHYAVFYPNTIFELYREYSFLNKQIKESIQREEIPLRMIKQAYKGFENGYNKFLSFKEKAFEFSYSNDDFGNYIDLIGELINKKVLQPLNSEDKKYYSTYFNPLANRDILLSEKSFQEIARVLHINFEKEYKALMVRIDLGSLHNKNKQNPKKTNLNIPFKSIAELEELVLYPDGQLFVGDKLVHFIDKHQGALFEFINYMLSNQKVIGSSNIFKDTLKNEFGLGLTDLINNANKRLREGQSKYLIRRKKTGTGYFGYSTEWIEGILEK